jgi:hypothetical protein
MYVLGEPAGKSSFLGHALEMLMQYGQRSIWPQPGNDRNGVDLPHPVPNSRSTQWLAGETRFLYSALVFLKKAEPCVAACRR